MPQENWKELGLFLKECRESIELDQEAIAEKLSMRLIYVQAMEEGRFEDLPGTIYIEAYIRSYGKFLGQNVDELIQQYRESAPEDLLKAAPDFVLPDNYRDEISAPKPLAYLAVLFAIVVYSGWVFMQDANTVEAGQPMVSEINAAEEQEDSSVVLLASGGVQVTFFNRAGEIFKDFTMQAGDTYFVPSTQMFYLKVSDPRALDIFIDGNPIEDMARITDSYGRIRMNIWELSSNER